MARLITVQRLLLGIVSIINVIPARCFFDYQETNINVPIIKEFTYRMNKVYAFIIIIPLIAILFLKTMSFYEFDTKQRYIKNAIDNVAHKVMLTGVMTVKDKEELMNKLQKLSSFEDEDIILKCGNLDSDGTLSDLSSYSLGEVLDRGEVFSIYIQSDVETDFSRMEGSSENDKLFYKAKAICRVEKNRQQD